jgi:hypothetical protein
VIRADADGTVGQASQRSGATIVIRGLEEASGPGQLCKFLVCPGPRDTGPGPGTGDRSLICYGNRYTDNFIQCNQLAELDHLQPAESQLGSIASSQRRTSPAQSSTGSKEPALLDRVHPVVSHFGSIASSQPKASPAGSSLASPESALLDRVQLAESPFGLIASSQPGARQAPSRPVSRKSALLDHL